MTRTISISLIILFGLGLLACRQTATVTLPAATVTPTQAISAVSPTPSPVTVKLVDTATATSAARPTFTPKPTATFTPSATPTPSPTPTNTPVPSARMEIAATAYHNGNYPLAQSEYNALLNDPGASENDRRLALYGRGQSELALNQLNSAHDTFALFVQSYPTDNLTRPAQFNQALALDRLGFYTETITAYQASLLPDDPIAAYIYERMGDAALRFEDFDSAVEYYLAGLNNAAETSFQVHLREGVAEAYRGQEDYQQALNQYQAILDVAQIGAYRAKIMRLMGDTYYEMGDSASAEAQYLATIKQYPEAYDSYLAVVAMVEAEMPLDEYQRGYTDYHGGNAYQPAIDALQRYLAAGGGENSAEAHWISAWSWRALGNYANAIAEFEQVMANYPQSRVWAESHLQRARTLGWQGEIDSAVAAYRDFANANPEHSLAPEALYKAALIEFQDDRFETAHSAFNDMVNRYPLSPYADDALYWAGIAAYLLEDYPASNTAWSRLLSDYPAGGYSRPASYWQAKTLLAQGDTAQANELLTQLADQSFNYYALRAEDLLHGIGLSNRIPLDFSPPTPEEQAQAEAWLANWLGLSQNANLSSLDLEIQGDPAFIRAEALHALGLRNEALSEYDTVKSTWSDNPLALYQLALHFQKRGANRLSILSALELTRLSPAVNPADVPKFIRRLVYPTYYQDLIVPQAENLGLDPALVFALIRQESLFEPQANSHADARGLMQIIPSTGADIAQRTNTTDYVLEDLWLPYRNVAFGSWFLDNMLNFFGGNEVAALAAYNAGPGRVQRWIEVSDDHDVFYALIPLTEPQEYIRRISLNLDSYRDIYGLSQ